MTNFELFKLFRVKHWWNFIVPPVLSASYFVLIFSTVEFPAAIMFVSLCFLSIVGTAVFGFFLNDWTDIGSDRMSGKESRILQLAVLKRWAILLASLVLAFVPWIFLKAGYISILFFSFQLILLTLYSVPPIRLKRNVFFGILCDSLYSGLTFILAILFLPQNSYFELKYPLILLFVFVLAFWMRGLRNILRHQIVDFEHDKVAAIATFVSRFGITKTELIIKRILFPLECLFNAILLLLFSFNFPYFYIAGVFFIFYFLYKFYDSVKNKKSTFVYYSIMNDYFEDLLPLMFLLYLSLNNPFYWFVLVFHCIIFQNKIIIKIFYDLLYRKIALWLFYKTFRNKYIKSFFKG